MVSVGLLAACGQRTQETKPIRKDITETVFAPGVLQANRSYSLTAQTDGYLIELNIKENDTVNKGQVLAVINNQQNRVNARKAEALYDIAQRNLSPESPLLLQARNSAVAAREKMAFDSAQAARYQQLYEANSVARADYEDKVLQYQTSRADYASALENYEQQQQQARKQLIINRAEKNLNQTSLGYNRLTAVYAGRVYKTFKERGDFVKAGDVIATIGDTDFFYAQVSVDEGSIAQVKVGQQAVVQLNINKTKTYKGKVGQILPAFNTETQSFVCKVFFTDSLDFKVVDTQLQANIITGQTKNALLIPRNYLGYGNVVQVKDAKQPVKVKTRFVSTDWVQVESGLDENTTIVTSIVTDNVAPQ
jgi:multidrug efflux pump subunit AcrA (membrane-fusion protein)